MKDCPECGAHSVSYIKLALQDIVPGIVAECSNCHSMVDFKYNDIDYLLLVGEWILAFFLIFSLIVWGSLWMGVVMFVVWRLIRLFFKLKGPIISLDKT